MKKQSSKFREEIARLQEQLKHAKTRGAKRIGRIALRAGIGRLKSMEPTFNADFHWHGGLGQ